MPSPPENYRFAPTLRRRGDGIPTPEILYRDPWLVVVHKPAGLLVHRSAIDRRETRFALQETRKLVGQRVYPVHRLDKPTSGALLFALDPETARHMTECFAMGGVDKTYLAVVRGFTEDAGCIDHPLREQLDKATDARADPSKAAQPAVTRYQRLATVELPFSTGRYPTARFSLVRATPGTGRKHQIRRHMKHIFHPIVGDTTHGDGRQNQFFRDRLSCRRLLLAATRICFAHPATGSRIVVEAPLEHDFQRVLDLFEWSVPGSGRP